jgi:hypothetical protein
MVNEAYESGLVDELEKIAESPWDPQTQEAVPKQDHAKRNAIIAASAAATAIGGGILARKQIGEFVSKIFKKTPTAEEIKNAPVYEKMHSIYATPAEIHPAELSRNRFSELRAKSKEKQLNNSWRWGHKKGLFSRTFGGKSRKGAAVDVNPKNVVVPSGTPSEEFPAIAIKRLEQKRLKAISAMQKQVS